MNLVNDRVAVVDRRKFPLFDKRTNLPSRERSNLHKIEFVYANDWPQSLHIDHRHFDCNNQSSLRILTAYPRQESNLGVIAWINIIDQYYETSAIMHRLELATTIVAVREPTSQRRRYCSCIRCAYPATVHERRYTQSRFRLSEQ